MNFADDLRKTSDYVNNGQMLQDKIQKIINEYITGAVSELKDAAMKAAKKGLTHISGRYYIEMTYCGSRWEQITSFMPDVCGSIHFDHKWIKNDLTRDYRTIWEGYGYNFTNEQLRNIGQMIRNGIINELRNIGFSNISVTTIEIPYYIENFWGTKKPSAEICDLQYEIYLSWS